MYIVGKYLNKLQVRFDLISRILYVTFKHEYKSQFISVITTIKHTQFMKNTYYTTLQIRKYC